MSRKTLLAKLVAVGVLAASLSMGAAFAAVPTNVDYSAQIVSSTTGDPIVSTDVDVTIRIYDDAVDSTNLLETFTFPSLDLSGSDGFVSLSLDFDGVDLESDLYLEVEVEDNTGALGAEILSPRQKVNSVPFALKAASIPSTISQSILSQAVEDATGYTDDVVANFGRVVYVNPASTAADPDGTLAAPFGDISEAYTHVRDNISTNFFNRVAIVLTPGEYTTNSTIVMDTVGIDLVALVPFTAFIRGTADPLVLLDAPTSGAWIRGVRFVTTGTDNTNAAVLANQGGRLINVGFQRTASSEPDPLLVINSDNGLSIRQFEIYGNVAITNYGVGSNTTFTDGFVTGAVTITGNSSNPPADPEFVSFVNCSSLGAVNFNPANPGFGVLVLTNVPLVGTINYDASRTVLITNTVGFLSPPNLPKPLPGSYVANTVANTSTWSGGDVVASGGNVPGVYTAFSTVLAP